MGVEYDDFEHLDTVSVTATDGEPLGDTKPHLTTIGEVLLKQDVEKVEQVAAVLREARREELELFMRRCITNRRRVGMWLVNCELSNRRVPPIFRNLPDPDPDMPNTYLDLVAYDLEWIATTYPKHVPPFVRFRKFMNPSYFHSQAKYIFSSGLMFGRITAARAVKGLGLTNEQQMECHCLKNERHFNALARLHRMLPEVKAMLEQKHVDRLLRRSSVAKLDVGDQTILRRRANTWFCGMLTDWSPTRTGGLFDALTGYPDHRLADDKPMSRQRAAKFISDVFRDLPKEYLKR